jgi:hypothetical protein
MLFDTTAFTKNPAYQALLDNQRTNLAIERGLKYLHPLPGERTDRFASFRGDLRDRLLTDVANLDPILGELRAFGTLRSAGFEVQCVPRKKGEPSQDFEVRLHSGAPVHVEVFTKQWDTAMENEYDVFANAPVSPEPGVQFRELEVMPFGKPRDRKDHPGDSVATNAVSRIAAIKARSKQLPAGQGNVLFIDFMRPDPLPLMGADQAFALNSAQGHISTGVLFAAIYGQIGWPIYESRPIDYGAGKFQRLAHPGRFQQSGGALSAIVTQHHDGLVLFENPHATVPLTPAGRQQFLLCPGAQLELFWAAFTGPEALQRRIGEAVALLRYFLDLDAD